MIIRVEDATVENIKSLYGRIKSIHDEEARAFSGLGVEEAIRECVENSVYKKILFLDNMPVIVFGVRSYNDAILRMEGYPYMVAVDVKPNSNLAKAIVKVSKKYVREMKDLFPALVNYVGVNNEVSIRWLKWCGFKFCDIIYTFNGNSFLKFVMED